MKLWKLAFFLAAANCVYQWLGPHNWDEAFTASYYDGTTILIVWINSKFCRSRSISPTEGK